MATDGTLAFVSDPEGSANDGRAPAVWIVALGMRTDLVRLPLPDGANPGAIEIDLKTKTAWVVARGARGVYAIDTEKKAITQFLATCAAPMDVAARDGKAWVACLGGEVVEIHAGSVKTVAVFSRPLTSIAVDYTSTVFAGTVDGTVLKLDGDGFDQTLVATTPLLPSRTLRPDTARRLVALPSGGVVMLFQQSVGGELVVGPPDAGATGGAYGGIGAPGFCPAPATRMAVVQVQSGVAGKPMLNGAGLLNDIAQSQRGSLAMIDAAGGTVEVVSESVLSNTLQVPCGGLSMGGAVVNRLTVASPIAAAFTPANDLVVLAGSPSLEIQVLKDGGLTVSKRIVLRPRAMPRGFDLFHQPPPGTAIACASCHPDGRATSSVLKQNGVVRRVMTLAGRLGGATRMHWTGDDFRTAIAIGTWEKQMGGDPLVASDSEALQAFLAQLRLPPRPVQQDDARIAGEAAFAKAQCGTCHSPGTNFTNDGVADVGHGTHKVPSLRGLAYSAPYMSDGCAATISQRFTWEACGGGDVHGRPSLLSKDETAALVAYLGTL